MMTSRQFFEVASDLSIGEREGDWRSAVSRAYFAAFHTARDLLIQCGFQVPQADRAHAYLWRRLSNSQHPDVVNAGLDFQDLRRTRNWADYDLGRFFAQSIAFDLVSLAEKLITLLEAVASEATVRTIITEAMKNYERDVLREVTWQP
jgi:uncharacterized protein (UPF0332 family)